MSDSASVNACIAQPAAPLALAGYSRFFQRLERRYQGLFGLLPPGKLSRKGIAATLEQLQAGRELGEALRVLRQLVLHRLLLQDVEQGATVADVTAAMSVLAEVTLDAAYHHADAALRDIHGQPRNRHGQPVQFWIIGMGKLGARELNVSSDIDLIYVYESDGETTGNADGRKVISNHEYFGLLVRRIQTLIGDTTEHGFVFRMDLALRPHGKSGPPAISLQALGEYFFSHGREWERFAWLKSRVVAPRAVIATPNVQKLRNVVLPFVFRRYLDYPVFDALRVLHRQIRDHASVQSAGRPERANDVKISRGGIREIEFIVQLLQVVRGGHFPELRCRPTQQALARVSRAGLMEAETAARLGAAYDFLRKVEHRIQYLDDQQTHKLPVRADDLQWIAQSLGFADVPAFSQALQQHRDLVAREFDSLLGANPAAKDGGPGAAASAASATPASLPQLMAQLPEAFARHLKPWVETNLLGNLAEAASLRALKLLQLTGQKLAQSEATLEGATRFADWMESMIGRESYFALLLERPNVHERLLHLLGAARWPLRYMLHHPSVIDELATGSIFESRFDAEIFKQRAQERLISLQRTGEDDEEALMDVLRRAHHNAIFRTLARDVNRYLTVEQVADDLSALADCVLEIAIQWCWDRMRKKHREQPQIAIIGYGKLGGLELGYGSDLDIVFVFDDDDENAAEIYGNLVRKLINWLTTKTAEGDLYEIDTALRPNGNSGLLITSFEAYANYQQQRGSNTAWTWEHQAMTRARFVMGSERLRHAFDEVRAKVIQAPRDHALLKKEIAAMRERMRQARREKPGRFDLKHSPGGMVDIEFATQYLVLAWSGQYPQLVRNAGNIALLQMAEDAGLLPKGIGYQAADAYRDLRRLQHIARLNEQPPVQEADPASPVQQAGVALWKAVFGD